MKLFDASGTSGLTVEYSLSCVFNTGSGGQSPSGHIGFWNKIELFSSGCLKHEEK